MTHYKGPARQMKGLLPMSAFVQKLTKTALVRRGIHRHQILLDWELIVGEKLAQLSCPLRITRPTSPRMGGTLHLQVLSGATLLMDSSKDLIAERVNAHYGYRVVERLKIIQTPTLGSSSPLKKATLPKKAAPASPASASLLQTIEGISDPELQQALRDFLETFRAG